MFACDLVFIRHVLIASTPLQRSCSLYFWVKVLTSKFDLRVWSILCCHANHQLSSIPSCVSNNLCFTDTQQNCRKYIRFIVSAYFRSMPVTSTSIPTFAAYRMNLTTRSWAVPGISPCNIRLSQLISARSTFLCFTWYITVSFWELYQHGDMGTFYSWQLVVLRVMLTQLMPSSIISLNLTCPLQRKKGPLVCHQKLLIQIMGPRFGNAYHLLDAQAMGSALLCP